MTPPILGIWASQISGHLWAPAGAYDALATVTVPSGGAASIDFVGIPSGYKHLQLRITECHNGTGFNPKVNFNSDTGANYSWHYILGNGTSASAAAGTSQTFMYLNSNVAAPIMTPHIIDILDYANTSKNKTMRVLDGFDTNGSGSGGYIDLWSGAWYSTNAITSITISGGTFGQYSQFALYGVK